ncbi:trypsin-like peptidase domain-containing protein [Roseovarius sp. SCSIO 43702]|uniref:trypsin-like serine peptidase n=1 Tax=Roseovarius sp. SCSIO 43702 TaxID=2823043 RepID=UPI001C732105|nr:serine protease [Roseovarius sp. SCSIO 43702]QYX56320.1 trypsin-like peptidase domain-containing protein [Roseovarius sp. SCSIO 43702]
MADRRFEHQKRILKRVGGTRPRELVARRRLQQIDVARLERVVERFRAGETLDEPEQLILFSIISPELRPAIPVVDDRPEQTDHPLWLDLNEDAAQGTLEAACRATGRIEYSSGAEFKSYGSGFLVAEDLILTNRHVADVFSMSVRGIGNFMRFGYSARVNFCRERDRWDSDPSSTRTITEIAMIHPWFDLALLRIEGGLDGVDPLALSVGDAASTLDSRVAIVGYPALNPDEDVAVQQQLISAFDSKHVSPGFIDAVEVKTFQGKTVRALGHDSSTLTGNSGSPVVDLQGGSVVGLHFRGNSDGLNWAVPSADIAADSRMIDAGVKFDGAAVAQAGPWETAWEVA